MIRGFKAHVRSHHEVDYEKKTLVSLSVDSDLASLVAVGGPYVPKYVINVVNRRLRDNAIVERHVLSKRCSMTLLSKPCIDFVKIGRQVVTYVETLYPLYPRRVHVYFVDALGKKMLGVSSLGTQSTMNLGTKEVNSGVTVGIDGDSAIILIYRKHESAKVLVHELLHAYSIDLALGVPDIHVIGRDLAKRSGIVSRVPVRLNETYIEVIASFMYAEATGIDVEAMRQHFLTQADKILCMMMYRGEFVQETHVFEYYIVKAALFRDKSAAKVADMFDRTNLKKLAKIMVESTDKYMATMSCGLDMLGGGDSVPTPPAKGAQEPPWTPLTRKIGGLENRRIG